MRVESALRSALAGVSLLVLSACSAEDAQPDQVVSQAAGSPAPTLLAAPARENEVANQVRQRVHKLPAFARLPGSDQAWVLAKAAGRIKDPNARELEPLVEQLAEVRRFAVAEREEPMPAPRLETPEVR